MNKLNRLCLASVACLATGVPLRTQEPALRLPFGEVRISNSTVKVEMVSKHEGETFGWLVARFDVTNATDRLLDSVTIGVDAFGPSGAPLTFPGDDYSCEQSARSLRVKAKKSLRCRWPIPVPADTKKESISIARFQIALVDAEFAFTYQLSLAKPSPNRSREQTFEDETVQIGFDAQPDRIDFDLRNKTQTALRIDWDQVAIVDLTGRSMKVIHQGIRYAERDRAMPPTTVPPGARIVDSVVASELVDWSAGIVLSTTFIPGRWVVSPLLPSGFRAATQAIGREFGLFLPISTAGKAKDYMFQFRIDGVK